MYLYWTSVYEIQTLVSVSGIYRGNVQVWYCLEISIQCALQVWNSPSLSVKSKLLQVSKLSWQQWRHFHHLLIWSIHTCRWVSCCLVACNDGEGITWYMLLLARFLWSVGCDWRLLEMFLMLFVFQRKMKKDLEEQVQTLQKEKPPFVISSADNDTLKVIEAYVQSSR